MKLLQLAFLATSLASSLFGQTIDWDRPDSVVAAAVEQSPSLAVVSDQIHAAKERVASAASLPNPMVMAGVQDQQIDLSVDHMMTMYMVGGSQTIVRPSRRAALRGAAELEVEQLQHDFESRRAEIEREARFAWNDAAAAQNEIAATREISRLGDTAVQAARYRYESGSVSQADLVRAMLEQSDLEHQLIRLRGRRNQAVARLLALLNLPSGTSVPEFLLAGHMAHEQPSETPVALPEMTPAIAALQADVQRAGEQIDLAKLSTRPDWNVEASYGYRPYEKGMFSVTGRIELPYRKSTLIEPAIREAIARRDAALQQIAVLRQQLQKDLGVAVAARDEAHAQIDLHLERLVPEAKSGFDASLAAYQSGTTTFDALLESFRTYLDLNLDYYNFLRQERDAEADIDALRRGARSGALSGNEMGAGTPPTGASADTSRSMSSMR